jgi:cytochrome c oxidase subunit II
MKKALLGASFAFAIAACGGSGGPSDGAAEDAQLRAISLTARQWAYDPPSIELDVGKPVFLEITSADVHHGFNLPAFGVRADAIPGMKTRIKITPDKAGTFAFHCDYYCGSGHEGMAGEIVVK